MTLEDDYVLPVLLENYNPDKIEHSRTTLEHISLAQLSAMRTAGIDPSWIAKRFEIPVFDPGFDPGVRRYTQGDSVVSVESWATHYTDQRGVSLNDSLRFSVGRTTELSDGNISGSDGTLNNDSDRDHVSSLTQSEGEYDIYDLSLEWEAMSAGPVTLSVLSGLKAIEANIGKRVTKDGDTTIDTVNRFTAMPMIGSGVRWKINDELSFSGAALTLPIDTGDALVDFNASTDLKISTNVGLSAGYRIIRSSFAVGSVDTEVNQEGLFARLKISF
jgi:hypothetical protein